MKKRSKFNLSHYHLMTGDMGLLYPAGLVEVLPGDTFQMSCSVLTRMSPLVAPLMHPIEVRVHHWFVPNRILDSDAGGEDAGFKWEDFITGGEDGMDTQRAPQIVSAFADTDPTEMDGDLMKYMGIPDGGNDKEFNAFPVFGYNRIFNEFYRDQDLEEPRDPYAQSFAKIAWGKDRFTTARPWPQKGPELTVPLGDRAPLTGIGVMTNASMNPGSATVFETDRGVVQYSPNYTGTDLRVRGDNESEWPQMYADLSESTGIKISDLRLFFGLQKFAEARARYGSRFTEYLRFLGVRSSDARLQRPEYLGGGKATLSVSEVLQTTPGQNPQDPGVGDLYGHGIGALRTRPFRRFFEEHGYIHTLLSVRPRSMYQDMTSKHWFRTTRNKYWQKELELVGQEGIEERELHPDGSTEAWGYQDRYRDYREMYSRVSGEFRDVLDYWHLARKFESPPALNSTFIRCDPSKRIFQVQQEHGLWMAVNHRVAARRLVSRNATPRLIG